MIRPSAGKILLLERYKVGYVPDGPVMYSWMRGEDLLQFVSKFYPSWDEAWSRELVQRLKVDLAKRFCDLSRGTKSKLSLVCALAHHPALLLLDEPTSGLDPLIRENLLNVVKQQVGTTQSAVLLSSHSLEDVAQICDRVLLLREGKVCGELAAGDLRGNLKTWFLGNLGSAS